MVQCRAHVRRQPDCKSSLPWHPARNGTPSKCPTNLSDSKGCVSGPAHDSNDNSSYIPIPWSASTCLQCPHPMDIDATRCQNAIPMLCRRCEEPRHFARECPKAYDVHYMSSDEREDWIERLLSGSDVAAAEAQSPCLETPETPEIPLRQSEGMEEDF